jgi:hypothetical protein
MVEGLTLARIVSLAAADAVNPCALAVLTLILIAILTYNPKKKRNVLLAGLAFTAAIYILYFIYGIIITISFEISQVLGLIRPILYTVLGVFAIFLGILNLKDSIFYKPGGFLTEMPMSWRPRVKKIISSVTSPPGAFKVGIFVTIFLLPCTIGPYLIAGGTLSVIELLARVPWLLLYNIIFVLPMLAITAIVYTGFMTVERVSSWKTTNIRYLHFIIGLIMLGLGIFMLFESIPAL